MSSVILYVIDTDPPEVVNDEVERVPDPTTTTGLAASVGVGPGIPGVGVGFSHRDHLCLALLSLLRVRQLDF